MESNQTVCHPWDHRPVAAEAATEIGFEEFPFDGIDLDSYSVESPSESVEIGTLQLVPVSLLNSVFRRSSRMCQSLSYLPHKPLSLS